MSFVFSLAWRDTRAARRRLLLYASTIVLGIAALVAVASFGVNVRRTLGDQPRRMLGGDLRVGVSKWPNQPLQDYLTSHGGELAREHVFRSPLGRPGQVAGKDAVQVFAADAAFPFYGEFTSEPAEAVARLRRGERVAIVDPRVAEQYRLKLGDRITLNTGTYAVAGTVRELPGESEMMLSLTGRIFVPWEKGAGGGYRIYVRLPDGADVAAIAAELKSRFATAFPIVLTAPELGKRIDEALEAATHFFALVMFVALFLGGIGVASALHVYIQERLGRVAILRCLGATSRQAAAVYLLQAAGLGLCGSLAGAGLGIATQFALPALTRGFFPVRMEVFLSWPSVLTGMGTGLLLCLVFALLPLLPIRRVSPLAVLRSGEAGGGGPDPWQAAVWFLVAASVLGFAYAETRSWAAALAYAVSLALAFGVFAGLAVAVAAVARRCVPADLPYVLRQGAGNLHRPRNRTALLLLAMGLGLFLVLTIYLTRATLRRDFAGENNPNLMVSGISPDDAPRVREAARREKIGVLETIPTLSVVLQSIDGRPFVPRTADAGRRAPGGGGFDGKLQATHRGSLRIYETLVAGRFTSRVPPGEPIVPVTVARWMTLGSRREPAIFKLGDEAVWQVEGVPVRTRIAGIREQGGVHLEPNFGVVFPEGAVDAAPADLWLTARSPSPAATARFGADLAAVPSAKLTDLALIVETIERVFAKVALVVDFIAFFTVATGVIILASAVAAGRHQRARESVLLRTLGATRGQLRWIQLVEYGVLGILAGLVGCGLAAAASALLAHFLLKIPAAGGGWEVALAAAAMVSTTVATGLLADRGMSRLSPLEILREET